MIHRLSLEIADYLFYRKIISIDKYDVYSYGLEMIISTVIGVILILICGILTNSFFYAIVFYGLFVILRMYTGGYHANSHITCKLTLCCSFLITNYTYYVFRDKLNIIIYAFISLFNLLTVIFFSPVQCSKKPLSDITKKRNKIISISLYIFLILGSLCLYYMSYNELALFSILVVSNVSVLMYIGIIKERSNKHEVR